MRELYPELGLGVPASDAPWPRPEEQADRGKGIVELKQALEDFISASGPSFLEVVTDVDEVLYPRIPAGLGYKDMILGPHMA